MSQGLQMNQRVEFLTDGGDTVRELPLHLAPESEHWLDWFHLTMRLTVMGQMIKGLAAESSPGTKPGDDEDGRLDATSMDKQLVEDLEWDLESPAAPSKRAKKLLKAVHEFRH